MIECWLLRFTGDEFKILHFLGKEVGVALFQRLLGTPASGEMKRGLLLD